MRHVMAYDINKTDAASLVRMMDAGDGEFDETELDRMLVHQMAAPLQFDMELASGGMAHKLSDYRAAGNAVPEKFSDLIFSPAPAGEILGFTKQFAKPPKTNPNRGRQKVPRGRDYSRIPAERLPGGSGDTG